MCHREVPSKAIGDLEERVSKRDERKQKRLTKERIEHGDTVTTRSSTTSSLKAKCSHQYINNSSLHRLIYINNKKLFSNQLTEYSNMRSLFHGSMGMWMKSSKAALMRMARREGKLSSTFRLVIQGDLKWHPLSLLLFHMVHRKRFAIKHSSPKKNQRKAVN